MRTNSRQFAIAALSFGLTDLLATGPIDHIRFTALCRGKRRFVRLRSGIRAAQGVLNSISLALWTVVAAVATRVSRFSGRMAQIGRVLLMFMRLYGLFGVSRRVKVSGWERVETSVPAEPDMVPAVAEAYPMPAAARITKPDEVATDKKTLVKRAKALIKGGMSRRGAAHELGVPESTLRGWMKSE